MFWNLPAGLQLAHTPFLPGSMLRAVMKLGFMGCNSSSLGIIEKRAFAFAFILLKQIVGLSLIESESMKKEMHLTFY